MVLSREMVLSHWRDLPRARKWALIAALLALGVILPVGCVKLRADEKPLLAGTINVGIRDPAADDRTTLKPGVFDRALLDYLVKGLGVTVGRTVYVKGDNRERLLEEGEVQLVVSTYSITPERERHITFVGPYLVNRQAIAVPKTSHLTTFDEAGKLLLCTARGTNTERKTAAEGPPPVEEADFPTCFNRVDGSRGAPVGVASDKFVLSRYLSPGWRLLVAKDSEGSTNYYGVGLPLGHPEDCERLFDLLWKFVYDTHGLWETTFTHAFPGESPAEYKPAPSYLRIPQNPDDSGYSCRMPPT